jgi:hypothetical protein
LASLDLQEQNNGTNGSLYSQPLISDISKRNVMLDGASMNYSSVSEGNVWLITFTYHHGRHTIVIGLESNQSSAVPEFPSQIVLLLFAILMATSMIGPMSRKHKISKS